MAQPSVLLVDDNEATCTLVMALLHRDFRVVVARDGIDAIAKLRTGSYAAILLDLRTPHLGASAVLELLRAHRPELLPTVLVLSKPIEVDTLLDAVRQCAAAGARQA